MTECSNCWQPISLIPGSCWWVYFTWRQLFLLLILLLLALAGGFISLGCWQLLGPYFTIHCNCWGFYFTRFTNAMAICYTLLGSRSDQDLIRAGGITKLGAKHLHQHIIQKYQGTRSRNDRSPTQVGMHMWYSKGESEKNLVWLITYMKIA
jgi:hypothetical protein